MKSTLRLSVVVLLAGLLVLGALTTAQANYRIINTTQLKQILESPNKPLLAFALSPIEFGAGYIPGSECVPYELVKNFFRMPSKMDAPIIFYCHGPGWVKSKQAAGVAVELGYTNVYWYRDGIKGWKKAGNPVKIPLAYLNKEATSGIGPKALNNLLSTDRNVILVDIRGEASIRKFGSIDAFTIHYPLYRLNKLMSELPTYKTLVLYDIRGKQAPIGSKFLKNFVFKPERVMYLKGGIEGWKKAGYPVNMGE